MKKHIVALMNEGISLNQIQSEVEKMFNEEYKKREEEQKKAKAKRFAEVNVALDRASVAVVDFMNSYVGEEVITQFECKSALKETAIKVKMAIDMENTVTQPADEDEEKLMDFLVNMGLIQPK
jgi:hypothetical protein